MNTTVTQAAASAMGGDTATRMAQETPQRPLATCGSLGPVKPVRGDLRAYSISELREHIIRREILEQETQGTEGELLMFPRFAAKYFGFGFARFISKDRPARLARPRLAAMAAARKIGLGSLAEIGGAFGGRDHGTVIHACNVADTAEDVKLMRFELLLAWDAAKTELDEKMRKEANA